MSHSDPDRPLNEPLRFAPFFRPQVWGGRRLQEHFGKPLPEGVAIGEAWELSAQTLHVSRVQSGPWQSVSLSELWEHRRQELLGEQRFDGAQFPWLIKWLDCSDRFSVQVHPNDEQARTMRGEPCGKTESWVVVLAEPSARMYAGLKDSVTRRELETRAQDGAVADCLHSFAPHAGDCIHIPAGTVHAVSGGVLMAEVQQTSDATFRLFDWNRMDAHGNSRALHLDQALAAIDFDRGPIHPVRSPTPSAAANGVPQETLVNCPYYTLDRFIVSQPATIPGAGLAAWILLDGAARLETTESRFQQLLQAGDVVLIPARVGPLHWKPVGQKAAVLLRTRLP